MLVVTDVEDVFLPLPDDMLVNLKDSRAVVDTLLDRLPAMHAGTQNVESALGPALKAAWNVMRIVGGKMLLFLSRLPSVGFASLKMREDQKLLGTDKEVTLLKPDNQFYKDFALDCSRQQIAVDLFLFSPHYTDVATLSTAPIGLEGLLLASFFVLTVGNSGQVCYRNLPADRRSTIRPTTLRKMPKSSQVTSPTYLPGKPAGRPSCACAPLMASR
jgi:hypothetical protein